MNTGTGTRVAEPVAAWRRWLLWGLIVLMALSTLNALRIVLTQWPMFVAAFPGADSWLGRAFAIGLPIVLLVALTGLWFRRRWACWLLATATVATFVFDLVARGPWLHLAAALVSIAILAVAIWIDRREFR